MRIAPAEPVSAKSLRKRANGSTMKLPPKVVSVPAGSHRTIAPAATKRPIASQLTVTAVCSPRNAPSISSAMAPTASTISGKAGSKAGSAVTSFIGIHSPQQQRGRVRGVERMRVAVEQLGHRCGRQVEHRLREDAEQDRQYGERPQR